MSTPADINFIFQRFLDQFYPFTWCHNSREELLEIRLEWALRNERLDFTEILKHSLDLDPNCGFQYPALKQLPHQLYKLGFLSLLL